MRIILKSIETFANLVKLISSPHRKAINDWFYNASDEDLIKAIIILNSKEISEIYPRHHLQEYIKFAQSLLQGKMPEPPTDLDLFTTPAKNHYNFARGGILLFSNLQFLAMRQIQLTFKKLSLQVLSETIPMSFQTYLKLTRPMSSMIRILMSRIYITYNEIFSRLMRKTHFRTRRFKTTIQIKKLQLSSIREMILKGRVNLEQRAFWTWSIVLEETKNGKVSSLQEDSNLLRVLALNSNLRYFHLLKEKFDQWKSLISLNLQSLLSTSPENSYRCSSKSLIKYQFKKKLKKKFQGLKKFIYKHLAPSFALIKENAHQVSLYYQIQFRLLSLKPHLRNLGHSLRKTLKNAVKKWKNLQIEYEYQETVITVSKERVGFSIMNKPLVLLDFYEDNKVNKTLARNLSHILMRKLRNYWKIWRKNIRVVIFGDDTLDLEEFKLPYSKNEKLRVVVIQLIQAHQTRINLQNVGLLKWMQNANKRNLTISKLKVIIQNHARQQELKKHTITSFKLYSRCQLEFTDIL
jgi:hypothetical protein